MFRAAIKIHNRQDFMSYALKMRGGRFFVFTHRANARNPTGTGIPHKNPSQQRHATNAHLHTQATTTWASYTRTYTVMARWHNSAARSFVCVCIGTYYSMCCMNPNARMIIIIPDCFTRARAIPKRRSQFAYIYARGKKNCCSFREHLRTRKKKLLFCCARACLSVATATGWAMCKSYAASYGPHNFANMSLNFKLLSCCDLYAYKRT